MKRILILILSILYVISITGCSAAKVEKEPVTIENELSDGADQLSEEGTSSPSTTPSTASDTSSTDSSAASANSSTPDTASVTPTADNITAAAGSDQTEESTVSPSVGPVLFPSPSPDAPGVSSELNGTISEEAYTSVIELEGMQEPVNYKTYYSNLGFQMAYDIDRFSIVSTQFEDGSWKDSFVAENPNPDIYPYSYITILRGDYSPEWMPQGENVIDSLHKNDMDNIHYIDVKDDKGVVISGVGLKESDELITQDTLQLGDNKAYHYVVKGGDNWNSMVREEYFLVVNNYVYIISANYFLEASEGYGARMRAMIDTITFN